MACDTCGVTGKPLTDLMSIYQTDKVKQVCRDCENVINAQLWEVKKVALNVQCSLLQRFLNHLRWRKLSPTNPCMQPGCTQTDGAPCAYPQCPLRGSLG